MNTDQLKPGDLIFYFNSNHEAEHIAQYAGSKHDVPYVLHATSEPYNALMLTRLVEADDGCYYRIMRPCNVDLALDAKQILLTWVEYLVPFASAEKQNAIFNLIDNLGGLDNPAQSGTIQERYGKKTYVANYSQYLLMANHLPFIPVTYTHEGKIEGLRCTEAIIAAFNIAQLMLHASQKEGRWVIERDATLREFVCSLDNPLPFDARATLPAGMYKHCIDTPTHWEDLGQLTVHSIPEPDLKCKADWREFKSSLKEVAMENTARFIESPKGSLQHHDVNHYFRFIPGAESSVSPPQMRIRSASTSSISPIQLSEEGSPRSRLRSSPIYCTFFTNNQSVESSLFLMPESASVDQHEKLVP